MPGWLPGRTSAVTDNEEKYSGTWYRIEKRDFRIPGFGKVSNCGKELILIMSMLDSVTEKGIPGELGRIS